VNQEKNGPTGAGGKEEPPGVSDKSRGIYDGGGKLWEKVREELKDFRTFKSMADDRERNDPQSGKKGNLDGKRKASTQGNPAGLGKRWGNKITAKAARNTFAISLTGKESRDRRGKTERRAEGERSLVKKRKRYEKSADMAYLTGPL